MSKIDPKRRVEPVPRTAFDQINAQQVADSQRVAEATASLAAERRASLRSRAGQWEESDEQLACPACDARYDFGDECPECHVGLVSEAFVHLFRPEASPWERLVARVGELFGIRAAGGDQ